MNESFGGALSKHVADFVDFINNSNLNSDVKRHYITLS